MQARADRRAIVSAIVAGTTVVLLFVVAIALLLAAADRRAGEARGAPVEAYRFPERTPLPAGSATLTVFEDGCGVIRSEVVGEVKNLTWSVRDEDGFEVLARNAAGELQYRYFRQGTYTVALTSFHDGEYTAISNTVTIRS
jgi:hypothetical protein